MPNWNGQEISVEAHRIALKIKGICGSETMSESFPVSGAVKTHLRNFYSATGGKRGTGPDCYEPTAREFRRVYNGVISGAALYKAAMKQRGDKAEIEVVVETASKEEEALKALKDLLGGGQKIDPEAVKTLAKQAVDGRIGEVLSSMAGLIADEVAKQVRTVKVQVAGLPEVKIDNVHKCFEELLLYVVNRKNVMIVGPAGSGKTFVAKQLAKAAGLDFYMSGKCADEVKITGYTDANGQYRSVQFRQAFEFGGLFLFDEMDGWTADALIAANAPLAGDKGDFPDGMVERHPNFVALAATNTFGRGADRQYVGREQLDAASLDRFAVVEFDYDEDLEMAISCNRDWTKHVQKVRAAIMKEKVRHVVSPRASLDGGVMIAAGLPWARAEESYIWKGLDTVVRNRVVAAMR
jgi:hypothetical protein